MPRSPSRESSLPVIFWKREILVLAIIQFLIIVWIVIAIIGVLIHGLIWLTILAAVLFLATLIFGGTRLGKSRATR